MKKIISLIEVAVSAIVSIMLLIIFSIFCINVISRYIFSTSFGWTIEFSLILWLWVIFLSASFTLKDSDHVSLNSFVNIFPEKIKAIFKAISLLILCISAIFMIEPVWDYIDFLLIRPSDILGIPMKYIFIVYMIFLASLIIKSGFSIFEILIRLKNKKIT